MQTASARQCSVLFRWRHVQPCFMRPKSTLPRPSIPHTDDCGIPTQPTWSVNDLLSSYPQPNISPMTLKRLHDLSALIPPAEGTPEHVTLTREMEGLVRLVEAVKLVDTSEVRREGDGNVPDGRIWAEGSGIELTENITSADDTETPSGRKLLSHSSRVRNGLYIVDVDKAR